MGRLIPVFLGLATRRSYPAPQFPGNAPASGQMPEPVCFHSQIHRSNEFAFQIDHWLRTNTMCERSQRNGLQGVMPKRDGRIMPLTEYAIKGMV
jgi:hypothetical protein